MIVVLLSALVILVLGCRYLWHLLARGDGRDIEFGLGSRSINRPSVIKPPKDLRRRGG